MIAASSAMGYDSYFVVLEAFRRAGSTDPGEVLEALRTVTHDGVTGFIEFDEIGDTKRDTAYVKSLNTAAGAWEFVAVQGVVD